MTQALSGQVRSQPAKFLTVWIVANFFGGFIVGFLGTRLEFLAPLILTGGIVGALQWGVLRRTGSGFRWWPLASAIGWIASTHAQIFSSTLYQPVVDFLWNQFGLWEVFWLNLVTGPIAVLGMAIAQCLILSSKGRFLWVWLLASLLGGVVEGGVGAALCAAICQPLPTALIGLVDGLAWAGYGVITGIAWVVFWGRRAQTQKPQTLP